MGETDKRLKWARFWRKFLRLTRGRVPVIRALDVIAREERDEADRALVVAVRDALERGDAMSEALARHPEVFSPAVIELARTAEKTGAWDEVVEEIAGGLEDGTFD
jgi:type IV pilus assembly protein PilC